MSALYELVCVDPSSDSLVTVPQGKTTIGRGPLMNCQDKRVSRGHAILEAGDSGELTITPVHVNPCFYKNVSSGDSAKLQPLEKDKPQKLYPGDKFSLLPSTYIYEVIKKDLKSNGVAETEKTSKKSQNNIEAEKPHNDSDRPESPASIHTEIYDSKKSTDQENQEEKITDEEKKLVQEKKSTVCHKEDTELEDENRENSKNDEECADADVKESEITNKADRKSRTT